MHADYVECGIDLEALERSEWEQTPPYLLADEQSFNIGNNKKGADILVGNMCRGQKKQLCTYGKALVSKNEKLKISFKNERFFFFVQYVSVRNRFM